MGTMILRYKGSSYKVITVKGVGGNDYVFDCKDLNTKQNQTLTLKLSGFLEALDKALPHMKNPKDTFCLDLEFLFAL